jgi:hypothetical protein
MVFGFIATVAEKVALNELMEPEVAVVVAATAAVVSPQGRQVLRRAVVLGVAGILRAADAVGCAARSGA